MVFIQGQIQKEMLRVSSNKISFKIIYSALHSYPLMANELTDSTTTTSIQKMMS